jgi:DNA-directed RNA polymerase specialized sigma24 family protein
MVILKVYEEKSYKEISEITGLSVSNVGYILHFAMKKLAEELKKTSAI